MVIDSATIEVTKRQGSTAELLVQRRPFAFSIKLSLQELQQLIAEFTQEATVWRDALQSNYYRVLGLDRDATPQAIRAAYRRLSRKFHPDVSPDTGAAMRELNAAYEALSDSEQRKEYDQSAT